MTKNQKIRVLFLLSNFSSGGAETQYGNLIKNIDRRRFEPILGLVRYKGTEPSDEFMMRFGDTKTIDFHRRYRLDIGVIFSVVRYCKEKKIDVIQSLLFMDNQIARFAGYLAHVPVITSIRGEIRPLLGKWKTLFEVNTQRFSDIIVVNSEWLKEYMVQMGSNPEKIVVIYNGTEYSRYMIEVDKEGLREKYMVPAESNVVTIVARLHEMKDHVTFLKAVAHLSEMDTDIVAIIAGDGGERQNLEAQARAIGVSDRVRFLGNVSSNIVEIYKISDVFMLTSQWGESFPNVILESMAAGVPVVASRISAVPEIITDGQNGFLVEKKDSVGFAAKAHRVLHDACLRQHLIKNGYETVRGFSVEKMIERYESLYQEIVRQ